MNQEDLFYKLIYYAAPTLAKEKPASLVNLKDDIEPLHTLWHQYKESLTVSYIELKVSSTRTLVLLYNEDMLEDVLKCDFNQHFLKHFGYKQFDCMNALSLLKSRFEEACPHEVGIFLGYPLHDVKCFANCTKRKCLAVGYWKVFYELDVALETFNRYDEKKAWMLSKIDSGLLPSEVLGVALEYKEAI